MAFWTSVINCEGPPPEIVLLLVQRLPDDSLTAALVRGGRQFFGWTQTNYLLADIYDALNLNTRASGNFKGKPPKFPQYPRPKKAAAKPRKVTLRSLHRLAKTMLPQGR